MKRFIAFTLALSLLISASCSSKDDEETRETRETEEAAEQTIESEQTGATVFVPAEYAPDFTFDTTDRSGEAYDESIFAQNELTLINFWEPWCGPCVEEMPDLEELYENYSDQGFLIIGVYATEGVESDVDDVLESAGITYPILMYTDAFDQFQSGYVPTSVLVDSAGHIIEVNGNPLIIGSNNYAGWEHIITSYLN